MGDDVQVFSANWIPESSYDYQITAVSTKRRTRNAFIIIDKQADFISVKSLWDSSKMVKEFLDLFV